MLVKLVLNTSSLFTRPNSMRGTTGDMFALAAFGGSNGVVSSARNIFVSGGKATVNAFGPFVNTMGTAVISIDKGSVSISTVLKTSRLCSITGFEMLNRAATTGVTATRSPTNDGI